MNEQLVKRLKSFAWRAGAMGLVALFSYISENVAGLGLSPILTVLIGLAAGEVTKFLNTQVS